MRILTLWCCGLLAAGCGGGTGPSNGQTGGLEPPPGGVAAFTRSPVDLSSIALVTALGHLAPPGHVLPTDHVYFYAVNFDARPVPVDTIRRVVVAPATGRIRWMMQPVGTDWKIEIVVTPTFAYYLDHVVKDSSVRVGNIVQAGERVGVTNPGGSIDLGAYDMTKPLTGFANPKRYPDQTLHCVSPWQYFVEPLKTQLYAMLRRAPGATDRDGRIDYDVPGHLVGNWFDSTVPDDATASGPVGWPKSVAFVYDEYDPSLVRISIGGTIAHPGIWTIPPDAPRPADVTVESGKVAYRLMYTESFTVQAGLMLVQMVAPDRIRIEVFEGSQAGNAEFDDAARTYLR